VPKIVVTDVADDEDLRALGHHRVSHPPASSPGVENIARCDAVT
jgi:hypothetical protein